MLELFKSFLKNISYQQKLQREAVPPPTTMREKSSFVDDKDELEELNAEMIELFGHINTVQSSYQEIVQSLISIQKNNRRHKSSNSTRMMMTMVADGESKPPPLAPKELMKTESSHQPISLEPFMNPATRNDSFNQLFQRVDRIRSETEQFRSYFTPDGTLQREQYNMNKITFVQYNRWHEQIQELAAIVELILQEYNRESNENDYNRSHQMALPTLHFIQFHLIMIDHLKLIQISICRTETTDAGRDGLVAAAGGGGDRVRARCLFETE
ncbi:hypothetical protein BLA29_008307 [Euroglyphus maynei]|uniref:Uncharacterized protein n=1 Tax=Euroglyphus maynei TaxID=6958 RepID=A0A1Y3B543_EURMA|nr:hypothetical protein BLA29_008307 [Euroglyphus maynei]